MRKVVHKHPNFEINTLHRFLQVRVNSDYFRKNNNKALNHLTYKGVERCADKGVENSFEALTRLICKPHDISGTVKKKERNFITPPNFWLEL